MLRNRKWLLLILASLLILISGFYFSYTPLNGLDDEIEPIKQSELKQTVIEKIRDTETPKDSTLKEITEPLSEVEIEGVPLSQLMAEISQPIYSEDPVLEVVSLSADFRMCKHPFFKLNKQADKNPQIKALLNEINIKCQAYAEQYPLWFNINDREESAISLPAKSILGEQYIHILAGYYGKHTDLDYDQLDEARIDLSLRMKSPGLISFGALDNGIGLYAPLDQTAFFKDLLRSKVHLWVFQVNKLALQSLSCELPNSQSCHATSFFMLYTCENDVRACGFSFAQWYESYTTPGIKKDVELLLQYYRDNY